MLCSDTIARAVIPSMPPFSPHIYLAHHLRHIHPLLTLSGTSATQRVHPKHPRPHCGYYNTDDGVGDEGDANVGGPEI